MKKRTKNLIDRDVQGALARRVIMHFVVFVAAGAMFGLLMQFLANPFQPFADQFNAFWTNNGPYLAVLVLMLPIFIYDTIKMSNRITGPIYRMRLSIREVIETGEPVEMKFRDGDFWQGLAPEFNKMCQRLVAVDSRETSAEAEQSANATHPEEAAV